MKNSDFDRLMERYVKGDVSPEEKTKIEAWLEVLRTRDATEHELTRDEEDRIFAKLTDSLSSVKDVIALSPRRKISAGQWMLRIAASLIIVSLLTYIAWDFADLNDEGLRVVTRNGVEKIILNDGSLVWLRGESKLVFYDKQDDGTRYSTFEGDALFEVAKDSDHPFILDCGGIKVRVVGTSFSIRTGVDNVELTVLTGKVNLYTSYSTEGLDLLPREKIIYRTNGEIQKLRATTREITLLTEGTEYDMQFTNHPMTEVVKRIGNKFNVDVNFSDNNIGNCRITADFTDTSLQGSLQMVSEVLGIRYSIRDNTVTISGKGCK